MFQKYEKDGHTIEATELAYRVIYAAQGYRPMKKGAARDAPSPVAEDKADDKGRSSAGNRRKGATARGRKQS